MGMTFPCLTDKTAFAGVGTGSTGGGAAPPPAPDDGDEDAAGSTGGALLPGDDGRYSPTLPPSGSRQSSFVPNIRHRIFLVTPFASHNKESPMSVGVSTAYRYWPRFTFASRWKIRQVVPRASSKRFWGKINFLCRGRRDKGGGGREGGGGGGGSNK